jgi:amino acid permease-like protein
MTEQLDVFDSDAKRLSELGYSQDLKRGWSSFENFAISFSIISVLAGPFTSFSQAWLNGGPMMISIGWPVVSVFILIVGLCMAELASSYPTAGGIYYWASKRRTGRTQGPVEVDLLVGCHRLDPVARTYLCGQGRQRDQ